MRHRFLLSLVLVASCSDGVDPPQDAWVIYPDPPATPVNLSWRLIDRTGAEHPCPVPGATVDVVPIYMRRGEFPPITYPCTTQRALVWIDPAPKEGGAVLIRVRLSTGEVYAQSPFEIVPATGALFDMTITIALDRD